MVRVNLAKDPSYEKKLKGHIAVYKMLFRNFLIFAQIVINRGNGFIALEWPHTCNYWLRPEVVDFLSWDIGWNKAVIKGCTVGLCVKGGKHDGKPLGKSWRIMTTMPDFQRFFPEVCMHRKGEHAITEGSNTVLSGRYTPLMVERIHKGFRRLYEPFGDGF